MKHRNKNSFSMTLRLPESVATDLENVAYDQRVSKATFVRSSIQKAIIGAQQSNEASDCCKITKSGLTPTKTEDSEGSKLVVHGLSAQEAERLDWCYSILEEENIAECDEEADQIASKAAYEPEVYELLRLLLVKMKIQKFRAELDQQPDFQGGEK